MHCIVEAVITVHEPLGPRGEETTVSEKCRGGRIRNNDAIDYDESAGLQMPHLLRQATLALKRGSICEW